eukprot:GHVU01048316.1.p1 GENE.GHVU01048316.1~~GHVU01048316.1.p1  ORF type:complete len:954 (-),score=58.07 GHVU01048316.1:221-3082(-)
MRVWGINIHPAKGILTFDSGSRPVQLLGPTDVTKAIELNRLEVDAVADINALEPSPKLTSAEQKEVRSLLNEYSDVFGAYKVSNVPPITFEVTTDKPIRSKRRTFSQVEKCEIEKQIAEMLLLDDPSTSEHASEVLLANIADGTKRFCIDFRPLNRHLKVEQCPIPRIDELVQLTRGCCYFISLDLLSGYWQLQLDESIKKYTAFYALDNLYEFNVLPFGLAFAPSLYQRTMQRVLALKWKKGVAGYIDDILIYAKTFHRALHLFRWVLERFREEGLTVKLKKCHFFPPKLHYLGYVVTGDGYGPDETRIAELEKLNSPRNRKELRRIMGLFGFYRHFLHKFAEVSLPLTKLLSERVPFEWTEAQQHAFDNLKDALKSITINYHFDPNLPIVLDVDSSEVAIGGVLQQSDDHGQLRPVLFLSHKFSDAESNWTIREKEAFGIVWCIIRLRKYLISSSFVVRNDNASLAWLKTAPQPKIARWAILLSEFDFTIQHRSGKGMQHVDCISRPRVPDNAEILLADQCDGFNLQRLTVSPHLPWEPTEFRLEQEKDPEFPSLKQFLLLTDGVWFCRGCPYIPASRRESILIAYHYQPWGGHSSIRKMLHKLKQRYFWPKMRTSIATLVSNCVTCLRRSSFPERGKRGGDLSSSSLFHTVALDMIGPVTYRNKKLHILTMIDHCSRWAESLCVEDRTAPTLARAFFNTWIVRYGVPRRVLTDRGNNFEAAFTTLIATRLGVRYLETAPYHPEGNGVCEAFNKTLKQTFFKLLVTCPDETPETLLAYAMMNYRSSPHSAIGDTPFFALVGEDFRLPSFLQIETAACAPYPFTPSMRASRLQHLREEMFLRNMMHRNNISEWPPAKSVCVGDLILGRTTAWEKRSETHNITGKQRKPPWSLPQRVTALKGNGTQVVAKNLYSGKEKMYSLHDVRPFLCDVKHELTRATMHDEVGFEKEINT